MDSNLDLSARLDFKTNQLELLFFYQNSQGNRVFDINLKPEVTRYKTSLGKESTKELISFLYEYLADIEMCDVEPQTNWNKERGVSAVVDTNPSRE